jgi:hypothetical protein
MVHGGSDIGGRGAPGGLGFEGFAGFAESGEVCVTVDPAELERTYNPMRQNEWTVFSSGNTSDRYYDWDHVAVEFDYGQGYDFVAEVNRREGAVEQVLLVRNRSHAAHEHEDRWLSTHLTQQQGRWPLLSAA